MIPQNFIDEVQARTDIAEVIAGYIPIKKAGRNFRALCPFHGEKTPSFMISAQKQIFHCFGCNAGGGAIQFVMLYEKTTFVEALEILAARQGMVLPKVGGDSGAFKNRLFEVMAAAVEFFQAELSLEKNRPAKKYLNERGIGEETIKQFKIGLSPVSGEALVRHLRGKGFTLDILEKASLAISRGAEYRDLFRGRVMFPIFDIRSRPVAFGARLWQNVDGPKYINSIEGPLYSKRDHLYGLNFSKDDVIKNDALIVVEGYLDMISPFMRGVRNIAASLGTALTEEQIRVIRRYTGNVILLFDPDKAGQSAALRAIDLGVENDLKVFAVLLPPGFDPDTVVRKQGKDEFARLIGEKKDFFAFKLDLLKSSLDVKTIDGKTKIVTAMLGTLAKLNNEVERYEYIKKLADSVEVREEILIAEFKKTAPQKSRFMKAPVAGPKSEEMTITEKAILRFLLEGKAVPAIRKNVAESDFTSALAKRLIAAAFKLYDEGKDLSGSKILNLLDEKTAAAACAVLIEDDSLLDKELLKSSILKLRKNRLINLKEKLKTDIQEAESQGDQTRLKELINAYGKINSEVRNG